MARGKHLLGVFLMSFCHQVFSESLTVLSPLITDDASWLRINAGTADFLTYITSSAANLPESHGSHHI